MAEQADSSLNQAGCVNSRLCTGLEKKFQCLDNRTQKSSNAWTSSLTSGGVWITIAIFAYILRVGHDMKTVQMTLDEDLVRSVDRVRKRLNQSRSAFTRQALRESIKRYTVAQQENRHRHGYERNPTGPEEFAAWESEQIWGGE